MFPIFLTLTLPRLFHYLSQFIVKCLEQHLIHSKYHISVYRIKEITRLSCKRTSLNQVPFLWHCLVSTTGSLHREDRCCWGARGSSSPRGQSVTAEPQESRMHQSSRHSKEGWASIQARTAPRAEGVGRGGGPVVAPLLLAPGDLPRDLMYCCPTHIGGWCRSVPPFW